MSIINYTYFKQQLKFPIDNADDDKLQGWINKEEPIILRKVLGYALYKEFKAGLVPETPATKWVELRDGAEYIDSNGDDQKHDGIFLIITDHVFTEIVSSIQSESTDSGIKIALKDNADNASPREKMLYAQNDMVNRISAMNDFINRTNEATPDTYEKYLPELIEKTNAFDL